MNKSKQHKHPTIRELLTKEAHISDLKFNQHGSLYYLSSNDGIGEIFHHMPDGKSEKISGTLNVRGTVGYGGGGFDVFGDKLVVCVKEGSIYAYNLDNPADRNLISSINIRTCSPKISPNGKWVIFVYSDGDANGLGITSINGYYWPRQLVTGADFYMQPTWHPNGEMIAWVEWHHPDMPWESSSIKIAQVGGMQLRLFEAMHIDGKPGASVNQPIFSPDGKWLSYIKRDGNWDNLCLYELESQKTSISVAGDGFHLRMPDWIQGLHSYQWSCDSKSIFFIKYQHGKAALSKVDISLGKIIDIDTTNYVWLSQISCSENNELAVLGSTFATSNEIVFVKDEIPSKLPAMKKNKIANHLQPQEITFQNREGKFGYGWYYQPVINDNLSYPPPCILKLHSGPTSLKHAGFSPEAEYFTLRGFAIAYLNYRGSVSFGYDYQNALYRKWGEAEVEDTLDFLNELSNQQLISMDHIAAMGSSAGGFSVLNLLIKHPGLMKAAICSYAVSDLVDDAEHTHKFERYYHRFLTGIYPEEKEKFIYRSPISHIDKIQDPVALFHGNEDRVVAASQSQKIYDGLTKRDIPCILKIFEGEGHGFRQLDNIEIYYQLMTEFLQKYI